MMSFGITPKVIPSRLSLATVRRDAMFMKVVSYVDYKRLERNKYAPWGRGVASKMDIQKVKIRPGNR